MRKVKKRSNYDFFLKLDTSPYRGKWIAIAENKVVASGVQADEAFRKARKKYPQTKISLAKVPQQESLVLEIRVE